MGKYYGDERRYLEVKKCICNKREKDRTESL